MVETGFQRFLDQQQRVVQGVWKSHVLHEGLEIIEAVLLSKSGGQRPRIVDFWEIQRDLSSDGEGPQKRTLVGEIAEGRAEEETGREGGEALADAVSAGAAEIVVDTVRPGALALSCVVAHV